MDDLKQSLKKAFEERFASPLFGYITLALLGMNWKPLAILFAGKEPVSERINFIENTAGYDWQFLIPVCSGALVAVLSPYLHLLLRFIHQLAFNLKDASNTEEIRHRYQTETTLAKEKVKSLHAESLETARQKTRESIQEARRIKIQTNIEQLLKEAADVKAETKKLYIENNQILEGRKQLESGITGIINNLRPLESAETADDYRQIRQVALLAFEKIKKMQWPRESIFLMAEKDNSFQPPAQIIIEGD